jgi:hypothetical protein
LLPEKPDVAMIQSSLHRDAAVPAVIEGLAGRTDNRLHVPHRVKENRDVFLISEFLIRQENGLAHFRQIDTPLARISHTFRDEAREFPGVARRAPRGTKGCRGTSCPRSEQA